MLRIQWSYNFKKRFRFVAITKNVLYFAKKQTIFLASGETLLKGSLISSNANRIAKGLSENTTWQTKFPVTLSFHTNLRRCDPRRSLYNDGFKAWNSAIWCTFVWLAISVAGHPKNVSMSMWVIHTLKQGKYRWS